MLFGTLEGVPKILILRVLWPSHTHSSWWNILWLLHPYMTYSTAYQNKQDLAYVYDPYNDWQLKGRVKKSTAHRVRPFTYKDKNTNFTHNMGFPSSNIFIVLILWYSKRIHALAGSFTHWDLVHHYSSFITDIKRKYLLSTSSISIENIITIGHTGTNKLHRIFFSIYIICIHFLLKLSKFVIYIFRIV